MQTLHSGIVEHNSVTTFGYQSHNGMCVRWGEKNPLSIMGQSQLSSSLKKIYSAVRWLVLEISKRHSRELKTCFGEDAVEGFKGGTNGRRWRYSLRPKVRGKHESTEEIDALLWQKERWRESNREREFQHELSTYCLTDPPRLWLLLSSPVCALVEPPASAERRSWGRRRIKDLPIITVLFSPCFCCCCPPF